MGGAMAETGEVYALNSLKGLLNVWQTMTVTGMIS